MSRRVSYNDSACGKRSDEPAADGLGNGVGPVDRAQLGEDDLESLLDRDLAAAHRYPDLAIGGALPGEAEDGEIVVAEVGVADGFLAGEPAEVLEDPVEQLADRMRARLGRTDLWTGAARHVCAGRRPRL